MSPAWINASELAISSRNAVEGAGLPSAVGIGDDGDQHRPSAWQRFSLSPALAARNGLRANPIQRLDELEDRDYFLGARGAPASATRVGKSA